MLRPEVRHIFRTERPTNLKLGIQMEYEDPYHRQAPWPTRSKVKVARSRDASDWCWPISREWKVPETAKLVGRLSPLTWTIMRTIFNVKRWKVTRPITVESPKVHNIYRAARTMNVKIGTRWSMRYQLPRPAIKACAVGFLHAGGVLPCRPHSAATQLVIILSEYPLVKSD